jgi:hypothetical protein
MCLPEKRKKGVVIMSTGRLALFSAILGGVSAILGSFPVAALVALVYRFPIPFAGMGSGPRAILPSLFAVLFYGILGGFLFVGILGVLVGLLAYRLGRPDIRRIVYVTLGLAVGVDFLATFTLAILDKIIGPW